MTKKAKLRIVVTITVFIGIGFFMMSKIPIGQIVLTFVWLFHLLYFIFGIKTNKTRLADKDKKIQCKTS